MKRFLFSGMVERVALVLLIATTFSVSAILPAFAQTQQQHDWCYADSATDAQTVEGCTALITSGTLAGRDLAIVYRNRGIAYFHTAQYDLALADTSQAVGLDPNYFEAYDDRGNAYSRLGQNDRAMADYNVAIRIKPTFQYAWGNRGYLHYKLGELAPALTDLNQAITLDASIGRFHINRALVYVKLHQCPEAAQDYVAAKQLNWNYSLTPEVRAACGPVIDAALSR
jgi:tetratricopeptide (TPR) repeat protein